MKVEGSNLDQRVLKIRRSERRVADHQVEEGASDVRNIIAALRTSESYLIVGASRGAGGSDDLGRKVQSLALAHWRDNPEKLMFCTREGTPYDNRDIVDQVLHPILERLGIARAGLHAFRHGNATIMDGLNAPMRVRQDRLGHEKAETTSAILMQSVEMIGELPTKSARFFAQVA